MDIALVQRQSCLCRLQLHAEYLAGMKFHKLI